MTIANFPATWDMFPNPCYDPQDRYGDCPDTMLDVLNDERIPAKDRIWLFCKCTQIPDNIKRMAAVRFVRETPIGQGRRVIDLITDQRSLNALHVAELHALGQATDAELSNARAAAYCAAAAYAYCASAAASAAHYAAAAAARPAQIEIIKSLIA